MKLTNYKDYYIDLDCNGCYEIGFHRSGQFKANYVGSGNIAARISTYNDERKCHNKFILAFLYNQRHSLYFRIIRTDNYKRLEARLLRDWGHGKDGGAYIWNQRYETAKLKLPDLRFAAEDLIVDLPLPAK